VAVLAVGSTCLVHVPRESLAVLSWRGGGTPALLSPGFALRIPLLQRVYHYPGGALKAEGSLTASSREGTEVTLPFVVSVTPDPQTLLALHQEGRGGGAQAALLTIVQSQLGRAAAGFGTYDLASGAASERMSAGLRLTLQERFGQGVVVTLSPPAVPAEVRALFAKEALYGRRKETGVRVVLLGIDGADWDVIDPMIARGELPHLARLKKGGAWARLRSSVPTLSPLLWTTVATGKTPDQHGINDFLVVDPRNGDRLPINSTFRKTKALWNILSDAGLKSDIIAWWATWPAEEIKGHLVSDRVAYSTFSFAAAEARREAVHPPEYAATVQRLRVEPDEVTFAQVARFLHISREEFRKARAVAAVRGRQTQTQSQESINVMVRVLAATETYRRVALDLLQEKPGEGSPTRLFAAYFQGVDEVSHRFAHCAPPRYALCPPEDYERFKDAVAAFYRYQDGILGEILGLAGDATVMVISDHGFASGAGRPREVEPFIEGKPGLWHDPTGIFIASGPVVRAGELPIVTLYNIAPTILYLLGLPVAQDMPGKALQGALKAEFLDRHPMDSVPSYEDLEPGGGERVAESSADQGEGAPLTGGAEEEIIDQLRSLGYVAGAAKRPPGTAPSEVARRDDGPAAPVPHGGGAVPTILFHTNLGAVYVGKQQYDLAEAEFRKALRIDPTSRQALAGLAALYDAKNEPEKALETFRVLVRLESGGDPALLVRMAELFIKLGRAADGVRYFENLQPSGDGKVRKEVGHRVALGMLYSAAGRPREAEQSLLKALALEPASITVMQELFTLYDAQSRAPELEAGIRGALAREPRSPMHHNWLALVLRRRGDLRGAEAEFKRALEAAPDLVGAMANLGSLYLQEGRTQEAVEVLKRAVDKDPRNVESRTNLIVALGMDRDPEGAKSQVRQAESAGQRHPLFYNALAYALHLNGRSDEALAAVRESLKIDPRQADALRLQAEIERGRPVEGLPYR
jgi:predicted AlkP superfamily phosphohydrolase/phosphomutase/Tfp pilus assembly protein PilF